ncbi:MAG: hypothetical protein Q4G05_05905 [Clostridia bacterium]|nr:hypothetical protein [Clostridia bacterium]
MRKETLKKWDEIRRKISKPYAGWNNPSILCNNELWFTPYKEYFKTEDIVQYIETNQLSENVKNSIRKRHDEYPAIRALIEIKEYFFKEIESYLKTVELLYPDGQSSDFYTEMFEFYKKYKK